MRCSGRRRSAASAAAAASTANLLLDLQDRAEHLRIQHRLDELVPGFRVVPEHLSEHRILGLQGNPELVGILLHRGLHHLGKERVIEEPQNRVG